MEAVRKPRLRVGVFGPGALQPRWLFEALARAGAADCAELTVVSVAEGAVAESSPLLWRAYCEADQALFGNAARWSERRDIEQLVQPGRRVRRGADDAAWRARIEHARLDVAIALDGTDPASLDGLARFGTWAFRFGEGFADGEAQAAVAEVLAGKHASPSGIRIRRPGQPDRIACPSWSRVYPFSLARSRDAVFAKTSEFLTRALRDLHAGGASWLEHGTEPDRRSAERLPGAGRGPGAPEPGLRAITTMSSRVASRAAERALTVDEWSIAFRFTPDETWDASLQGFFRLQPPKGWYWADPFPIQANGRNYIFFEELPYGASRAHISVVEVDRGGNASKPEKVLERDYHLSYPFLVEEDGQLYMIPETAENHTVEIYRCVDFPRKWKLERALLRGVYAADATLHREGDKWWMFANASALPGADVNDELHLYSADRLLGEWTPHGRNPVKSDVRSARPAGRLFRRDGRLYRPGQICTPLYGSGIALHEVKQLSADGYVEEAASRIVPRDLESPLPWGGSEEVLGIHTINRAGDLSVTDAFVRRARF